MRRSPCRRSGSLPLVVALVVAVSGCSSGDRVDPKFDTRVARPAYGADGPRVLFDEGHHNVHRAGTSFRPFVRLIESDGYRVISGRSRITTRTLAPYSVLVIVNALGTNERNDDPAFDGSECDAIRDWV